MNRRRVPGCDAKSAADAGPSFTPCNLSPPLPWYITQQMGPFHRLSIVTVTDVITCCMLTQHEKKSGTFNSRGQICAKKPLSRLAPSNDGIPICTGPACILGSFSVQCIVRKREGKWDGQCGTRREENLGRVGGGGLQIYPLPFTHMHITPERQKQQPPNRCRQMQVCVWAFVTARTTHTPTRAIRFGPALHPSSSPQGPKSSSSQKPSMTAGKF
jgi:hypothetical protein